MQENGKREVFFETFGVPRVIEVEDRSETAAGKTTSSAREKADSNAVGEVGAPMGGDVLDVRSFPLPPLHPPLPLPTVGDLVQYFLRLTCLPSVSVLC